MNKDLRLSRVLLIVILAIILILVSLNISELNLLVLLIPIPFALIGTLSNLRNNIIALLITFIAVGYFISPVDSIDIFLNSIVPGAIIGIIAKRVINNKNSNKYEPIFIGTIILMISIIINYLISKYLLGVDLLEKFFQLFNSSLNSEKSVLEGMYGELLKEQNVTDVVRNIIPSILFFRGIILSIIIYSIEIYTLRKMKYGDLSHIKFKNFYLPGNAIIISLILYLLTIALSYMNIPLYTDAIFLNLQIIFNFMFIIQGIAVVIYFLNKWLKQGVDRKLFIGALCVGIFGMTCISFIGMVDSILDFRKVRDYKPI